MPAHKILLSTKTSEANGTLNIKLVISRQKLRLKVGRLITFMSFFKNSIRVKIPNRAWLREGRKVDQRGPAFVSPTSCSFLFAICKIQFLSRMPHAKGTLKRLTHLAHVRMMLPAAEGHAVKLEDR